MLSLTSCEFTSSLAENLGTGVEELIKHPRELSQNILGIETEKHEDNQGKTEQNFESIEDVAIVQDRLNMLMMEQIINNSVDIDLSFAEIEENESAIEENAGKISINTDLIEVNEEDIKLINDAMVSSFSKISKELRRLRRKVNSNANIQAQELSEVNNQLRLLDTLVAANTIEIIDPCGDGPGVDEVILKIRGELIAYFQAKNVNVLATLSDGHYVTSDKDKCRFSVVNGEVVEF